MLSVYFSPIVSILYVSIFFLFLFTILFFLRFFFHFRFPLSYTHNHTPTHPSIHPHTHTNRDSPCSIRVVVSTLVFLFSHFFYHSLPVGLLPVFRLTLLNSDRTSGLLFQKISHSVVQFIFLFGEPFYSNRAELPTHSAWLVTQTSHRPRWGQKDTVRFNPSSSPFSAVLVRRAFFLWLPSSFENCSRWTIRLLSSLDIPLICRPFCLCPQSFVNSKTKTTKK